MKRGAKGHESTVGWEKYYGKRKNLDTVAGNWWSIDVGETSVW